MFITVIPGLVPGTPLSVAGAGGAVRRRTAGASRAGRTRGSGRKARNDGWEVGDLIEWALLKSIPKPSIRRPFSAGLARRRSCL